MRGTAIPGNVGRARRSRVAMFVVTVTAFTLMSVEPAFAFNELATNIVGKANDVAGAIKAILFAAAVVAVMAGAAPMLWGEVKVRWMVSALAACAVISMMGLLVNAFVQPVT